MAEEYVWLKEEVLQSIQYFNGNNIDRLGGKALTLYNQGLISAEQFNDIECIIKKYMEENCIVCEGTK